MKIGFDLDGIFIDTPPLVSRELLEKFYKAKSNGKLLYRIPSRPEQLFRKATHLPMLRPPIKENIKFLKSISKKKNELYLISSRYKFLEKETDRFIKKHELDKVFDGIYLNYENKQAHTFKNDIIKKLKLDIHVDDDAALINFIAKESPQKKFFWLTDLKENHALQKNVIAINKLSDILK